MIDLPKENLEFFDNDELRARIFYEKYSLSDIEGNRTEKTPLDALLGLPLTQISGSLSYGFNYLFGFACSPED